MSDTIAAAFIGGFVALVVGTITVFGTEAYRRHRDAISLAGALAGEIAVYVEALPMIESTWGELERRAAAGTLLVVPNLPMPVNAIYDHCARDVGLLGPKLASEVAYLYGNVAAFRGAMAALISVRDDSVQQAALIRSALVFVGRGKAVGSPLLRKLRKFADSEFLE